MARGQASRRASQRGRGDKLALVEREPDRVRANCPGNPVWSDRNPRLEVIKFKAPGGTRTRFEHFAWRRRTTTSAELRGFSRALRHPATSENSQQRIECGQNAGRTCQARSQLQAHVRTGCGQVGVGRNRKRPILGGLLAAAGLAWQSAQMRVNASQWCQRPIEGPDGLGRTTGPVNCSRSCCSRA